MIIYFVILTWIILFKTQFSVSALPHIRSVNLIPFAESVVINGKMDFDEIINNCIVFIPIGLYTGMLMSGRPLLKRMLPALGLSLFYETAQFVFAIGATDITDVIANTLGGLTGVLLVSLISRLLKDKTNKVLNVLAIVCTLFVVGFLLLILVMNSSS